MVPSFARHPPFWPGRWRRSAWYHPLRLRGEGAGLSGSSGSAVPALAPGGAASAHAERGILEAAGRQGFPARSIAQ